MGNNITMTKNRVTDDLIHVNMITARRLFEDGHDIYLLPNNIKISNKLGYKPYRTNKNNIFNKLNSLTFYKLIYRYEHYNCNTLETGKTCKCYV